MNPNDEQLELELAERKAEAREANKAFFGVRLLRLHDVEERTGLSRQTIHRLERTSNFPARRRIGSQTVRWLEKEVNEWILSAGDK